MVAIIVVVFGVAMFAVMKCRKRCLRRTDLSDQFSDPTETVQSRASLRSNLFSE